VSCHEARCLEKTTQPPTPFTDATLLSAMTGIARFVQDAALRRTLRETDGLGTEATRAAIIQTLFNRGFLFRDKRAIHATDKGWTLIEGLPENATTPTAPPSGNPSWNGSVRGHRPRIFSGTTRERHTHASGSGHCRRQAGTG